MMALPIERRVNPMRFSRFFWNTSCVLLAIASLILIAGMAGAILDEDVDIYPAESPNYDESGGYVDASGNVFASAVYFRCLDDENHFIFVCETDHPDKVSLWREKGRVDQRKRGNNAHVWFQASKVGGLGVEREGDLICEQAKVKSKTNARTEKIEAQCMLKGCEIPFLTSNEIRSVFGCLDNAVENGNLGKKVQNLKRDSAFKISGKIKSKGFWGDAGLLWPR
jgi:hypothetical protein